MVFETVISNILNTYLSEFIDDLSASQLKVGALRGDVHINNLAIKGNALDTFNLPFRVVYGHIGSFIARIPWVSLYTSPVCFDISKVFIVCVPNPESKYDPEIERKLLEANKKKQLEKIEEAIKNAASSNLSESENQKGDDFVSKLIAQVVKNIEVRLTNVHICYEDRFSNAKLPFLLGITLHKLSFVTKDTKNSNKSKSESLTEDNYIQKAISLECLSIYWNCSKNLEVMSNRHETEIDELLLDGIATHERTPHLNYILIPNNFNASAMINRKPKKDNFNVPVIKVDMLLDQFSLNFNRKQFESFVMFLDALNRMKIAQAYRQWRPIKQIQGNSQKWWKFAITSIIETEIKRKIQNWSWTHIKEHRNRLKEYKIAYKEKILNQNGRNVIKAVQELESKLDVFNIILVRSQVDLEINKEREKSKAQEKPKGWFNWFWDTSKQEEEKSESKPIIEEFKKEITSDEKIKLYEAIGYEEDGLPTDYPLEFVAQIFSAHLKKFQLTIQGEQEDKCIVKFCLSDVSTELGFRPGSNGTYMLSKIRDISMLGCNENPMIVHDSVESDFLSLQIDLNPVDKKFDYGINFKTKGVNLIFDSPTLNSILEMAIPPNNVSLEHIQALAEVKLQEIKMMSATGLEYAIEQHKKLMIIVNIEPSFLIVPDHGKLDQCCDVLLLSSGHMKIVSELKESQKISKQRSQNCDNQALLIAIREGIYERYVFSLSQVEMILSTRETWNHDVHQSREAESISERHFLKPFDIDLTFLRSIIVDDPDIPNIKVEGAIPSIYFKAKDNDLIKLMNIVFSIPILEFGQSAVDSSTSAIKSSSVQEVKVARDALKFVHRNVIKVDEVDCLVRDLQITKFLAKFSVQDFTCDLRNSSNKRLLIFSLKKVGAFLTMKTFGISSSIYLGQILANVFDTHCSLESEASAFKLVETSEGENVLQLNYEFCHKNSPTFENIIQKVNIELSHVKCTIDSSILDELLFLTQRVLNSLPQNEKSQLPDSGDIKHRPSLSQSSKSGFSKHKKKLKNTTDIAKIINLGGFACIESVVIVINEICSITFEGLRCDLNTYQSGFLTCSVRWNDFLICNDIKYGLGKQKSKLHPHVIKSESDKVLEMMISMYPESFSQYSIDNVDLQIKIHFGRLKIVFLNEFVLKLTQFLDIFQVAKQKAIEASSMAAVYAKKTALVAYESAYKMGIDIILEAPLILVPQSWESKICLLIDLGKITITNKLEKLENILMDYILCELTDTKVSMIDQIDDKEYDNILEPISFEMKLNRNLSFENYKSQPEISLSAQFQDIKLKMSQMNFSTLYKILDENINAGFQAIQADDLENENKSQIQTVVENHLIKKPKIRSFSTNTPNPIIEEAEVYEKVESAQEQFFIRQSCSFTLPRIEVFLYNGQHKKDFNKFSDAYLLDFVFFANIYTNFDISASLNIRDIVLCDARATRKESGFKKLVYSKIETNEGRMMRVTLEKKKDTIVDVNMSGFTLIFALDYLLQLSSLLLINTNEKTEIETGIKHRHITGVVPHKLNDQAKLTAESKSFVTKSDSKLSLIIANFKMSKADIVLMESIDNLNSPSVILNNLVEIGVKMNQSIISMSGSISQIQIGITEYNKYQETGKVDTYILKPFEINITAKINLPDCQHIDIVMTEIGLYISPSTVQILLSILSSLGNTLPAENKELEEAKYLDETNIFKPKPINIKKRYWFLNNKTSLAIEATDEMKTEESLDVNIFPDTSFNMKQLIISISSVTIVIESGGIDSQPLIKLNSSYSIIMENWSHVNLFGTCFMDYYNEKNFTWEPIIEVNENECWSYNLKLDLVSEPESYRVSTFIESKQQLELTLSHSAICVINDLAESFTNAVKQTDSLKMEDNLLIFSNFTGMNVTLLVSTKRFSHDHLSNGTINSNEIEKININPGEEFVMKSILNEKQNDSDTDIICEVSYCNEKIIRRIGLRENEQRCYRFPLISYPGIEYKWVIDTTSSDSSRSKRFIFGSLVEIENLIHIPLSLYYIDISGNLEEYTFLTQIQPNSSYYLPIDIVYSMYKCVFVKPNDDYCTPKEAICWKLKQSKVFNESFSTIVCESKKNEPNYYLRVKSSAKEYFLEDTNKSSLSCLGYKFEIHPMLQFRNLLPVPINYTINNFIDSELEKSQIPVEKEVSYFLASGETHNLCNINTKNNKVKVVLKNYLNQDWKCENRFPHKWSKDNQVEIWSFSTFDSNENVFLDLAVDFLSSDESHMRTATLFSPFWMINKTGLPLTYKLGENFISHSADFLGPILLCFKSKNFFSKKKLSLSIANSKFSESFSIDAVGNQGNVIAKDKDKVSYCASISIELSSFTFTKIVTISPFYSILNKSSFNIDVSEDKQEWIEVKSLSNQSLWPKDTKKCFLYIRLQIDSSVSEPISLKDSSSLLLRIGNRIINAHIDVTDYSVIVQLTNSYKGSAPVRIFNFLEDTTVDYGQYLVSYRNRLPPMQSTYFTWYEPAVSPRNLIWNTTVSEEIIIDLSHDAIGKTEDGEIFWVTFLDGKQRVLIITRDQFLAQNTLQSGELIKPNFEVELLLKGIGISLVNIDKRKEIAYIGITSSEVIWEVSRGRKKRYRPLSLKQIEAIESAYQKLILREKVSDTLKILKEENKNRLVVIDNLKIDFHDFQEMKIIEPIKGFLRRNSAHGIWCTVGLSPHMIQFHSKINRVQIDNQMNDCVFNIIMCPVTPPRSLALDRAPKAFFEVTTIIQKQLNMIRFKYITVLIQEFLIQIDGDFMMALFELVQYKKKPLTNYKKLVENAIKQVSEEPLSLNTDITLSSKNYYDLIHFSPIKVHVSFNLGSADSIQLFGIFDFLIKSAGVTLTEFKDVLFKIDYFERKNILLSNNETISLGISHYLRQILKQFYVVVLGLDVIGNPVGLLMGLKQGVGDLFYEPYMGIIQGPEEFAEGLALGIRSLFSHTVGGAAGALGKITGTLGDGISTLTMDQEARKKRRERMNRKTTLAQSGKDLARGFFTGVTGIITKPLRRAKREGFEGLMKGVGQGVVGVVADPATGVIDFASGSLNALQRAININTEAERQRPTRHFQNDGILRPYNLHEANGKSILQDLQKNHFITNDNYFNHCSFANESVALITDQRLLYLTPGCLSKELEISWEEPYDNILSIEINEDNHIIIILKEQRKRLKGFLGSKMSRTLVCNSLEVANWIVEKIEKAKKVRPIN